ncbi:hypothetical protein GQ53DRAFT_753164 [Thozetella sp. PMI_491]|nr:hypothetical protein GQ53DRAFT_753164 [Thozetella sp. PMI_491]
MASHEPYSDLQVVPDHLNSDKIVVEHPKYAYPKPDYNADHSPPSDQQPTTRRICGLVPKLFWGLAAGIAVAVVIAAVVGGVIGSKNASTSNDKPASSSAGTQTSSADSTTPSNTPTSTAALVISTTTEIDAKHTLLRDCPSSNNTIYNALGSSQFQFRKLCNVGFKGNAADMVNTPTSSLNDCIDLCVIYNTQNKTEIAAGKSDVCNSVCWRHGLDSDFPGQCFAATTTNSSVIGFNINYDSVECDSAGWINQVI